MSLTTEELKPAPETPKVEPAPKVEPTLLGEKVSEGEPKEKPEGEPKKEEAAQSKPAEEAKSVPEKYELKLPEGSVLDAARVEKVIAFAKANGLSQDEAQRVLERENDAVAQFAKEQNDNFERVKGQWLDEAKSDTEFGGEKLKESVMLSNNVIKKFGSDKLRESLNATGLGNHPELVRMLVRIGKEMGPDKLVVPGSVEPADSPKPVKDRVWGYMNEGKSKP